MRVNVWLAAFVCGLMLAASAGRVQAEQAAEEPAAESPIVAADEHGHAEADSHGGHGGGHHEDLGHGDASESLESPAQFRTDLAIYTFAVFLLLLAILSRAAWPTISSALIAREKRIEDNLAAADAKHEEAKRLLAQHEARLASAAAEVRAMLEEARRDADATKEQIIAEARHAAGLERDRALRDIDTATSAAMKHIAETSANLAVDLAGKVIRETVSPGKQQELVRVALAKLGSTNPSNN